ncbi:hypothetical protein IC007_1641 [Sulfuracidifex tepidarius]|uniref:Uncharacterized protein n=1 Tax=Sulfuracidifex tepidarius TaxID=1294262 RepID=A0A510E3M1_9CREN|nr:hypothetical protein IC007_1641 [Sulfuracidifex tepidarius]
MSKNKDIEKAIEKMDLAISYYDYSRISSIGFWIDL